jgi:hypothetical protein
MDLEARLAKLESDNRRLKVVACVAAIGVIGLALVPRSGSMPLAVAQDAKQGAANPGALKVTKLILVDAKGKDRVALSADEDAAAPNAPVFRVLDLKGKVLARIGDTADAGPAIQFFVEGKRTASYSHMSLSLRATKADTDRLYLGLPRSGDTVSPTLKFQSRGVSRSSVLSRRMTKGAPSVWLTTRASRSLKSRS